MSADYAYGVAVDSGGNSYIAGYFGSATYPKADFGSITLKSNGSPDTFIAKIDTNGNYLRVMQGGGINTDYAYGVAVDSSGNSYIAGMSSATNFGSITLTNSGSYDIFIAKLPASPTIFTINS